MAPIRLENGDSSLCGGTEFDSLAFLHVYLGPVGPKVAAYA